MKRKLMLGVGKGMCIGLAAVLCAALAGPLWAQSCDLQVRDGSAAADIGRIHRCLNDRLNRLESRMDAAGGAAAPAGAAPSQRNVAEFDAGSFALSVVSAKRQRQSVLVLFSIVNKTTQDIYVGVDTSRDTYLIDEGSNTSENARSWTGIQVTRFITDQGEYTLVPANTQLRFSTAFSFDLVPSDSGSINVHLRQFIEKSNTSRRITAPFRIAIRN